MTKTQEPTELERASDPTGDALRHYLEKTLNVAPWASEIATAEILAIVTRTPPVSMDEVEALLSRFDAELLGLHRDPYINSRIVSFGFLEDLHDLLTRIKERRA